MGPLAAGENKKVARDGLISRIRFFMHSCLLFHIIRQRIGVSKTVNLLHCRIAPQSLDALLVLWWERRSIGNPWGVRKYGEVFLQIKPKQGMLVLSLVFEGDHPQKKQKRARASVSCMPIAYLILTIGKGDMMMLHSLKHRMHSPNHI